MLRAVGSAIAVFVLSATLIAHSGELFHHGLPNTPDGWAWLSLFMIEAMFVLYEIRHYTLRFGEPEVRRNLSALVGLLGWGLGVFSMISAQSSDSNTFQILFGFFVFTVCMFIETSLAARVEAGKIAEQASGGVQLEFQVWERWNGKRRLELPRA